MAEKIFEKQANFGWGFSFNMTSKAPAVAKRIWDSYADALAYVNDYNDSAIEGILLSVVADEDEKNNGVYFVQRIKKSETDDDAILVKVGSGDIEELAATFNQEIENLKSADASNKAELEGQIESLNDTLNTTIGTVDEGKTVVGLIDATNELVSANKTALEGQIATLKSTLDTKTNQISSTIGTVADGQTVVGLIDATNELVSANKQNIDDNKKTIDAYTVNNKLISTNPVLSSDDLLVGGDYSVLNQKAENVSPGDIITTAISKLEVMLANTTLALTAAINDLEMKIGSPSSYDEDGNITTHATGLYAKYEELAQQIQTN